MARWPGTLAMGVVCSLAAGRAAADSTFCILHQPPVGAETWYCADSGTTGAAGWSPVTGEPDSAGPDPRSAAESGSNGGAVAATASAHSTADPGLLRVFAAAETLAGPPDDGISFPRSSARANAMFFDVGTLVGLGGAAPGTAVDLHLTVAVGGGFQGASGGDGELTVYRNGGLYTQRMIVVNSFLPASVLELGLPGFGVGDSLGLQLTLTAFASAISQPPAPTSSIADLGSTGRVFLDVLSDNAVFAAASLHDYRSIPVPEPSSTWLVGAALAAALRRARLDASPPRARAPSRDSRPKAARRPERWSLR